MEHKSLEQKIKNEKIDPGQPLQVIRKARIFNDIALKDNLKELEIRAQEVEKELEDEEERERQLNKKVVRDDSIFELENISDLYQNLPKKVDESTRNTSFVFKCNSLSDSFLFGDDIKVPLSEKGRKQKAYQTTSVADPAVGENLSLSSSKSK